MADNTTQYGNAVISADDVGGVLVQRVKVQHGVDGSATDVSTASPLPITAPAALPVSAPSALAVTPDNMTTEFRDEQVDTTGWTITGSGSRSVQADGNAASARYLRITLDPRDPTAIVDLIGPSARAVKPPFRVGWGISASRRNAYMTAWFGLVGCDANGTPVTEATTSTTPLTITGGVVVTGAVLATVTTTTAHGLMLGDRVVISGIADPRANVYAIVSGIPSPTSFTYATTLASATYGSSGTVTPIPAHLNYVDCLAILARDSTAGNADAVARAEGLTPWVQQWNPAQAWDQSTVPSTGVNYNASYVYPHQPQRVTEFVHEREYHLWQICPVDSTSTPSATQPRDQTIPLPVGGFVLRGQVRNLPHIAVPLGDITAVSKSGSTTATITIPNHGLTTSDFIGIFGIKDQANFANLTTATAVASVLNSNQITIAFGASATASSYGGTVVRFQQNTTPTFATSSIQTITTLSNGRTQVTFAASQGTFTIGESICLTGLVDSGGNPLTAYEGLYRVAATSTTTFQMELEPLQSQASPSTTTVGGTLLAAPDWRVHFTRGQAHGRTVVEIESGRGHARQQSAVPVTWGGNIPAVNLSSISGTSASSMLDPSSSARSLGVFLSFAGAGVADKASGAVSSSTNSGSIANTQGQVLCGLVNVTAATGTNPTLDVVLQESYDGGTTWQDAYHLQRLIGTGTTLIPPIVVSSRFRWDYRLTGTSPSFTFAITTMRSSIAPAGIERVFYDRSITPNTLNATGTAQYIEGCRTFGLVVVSAAAGTVAPTYGLQFSTDAANWWTAAATVAGTTTASTQAAAVTCPFAPKYVRPIVTAAGTGATLTHLAITATT